MKKQIKRHNAKARKVLARVQVAPEASRAAQQLAGSVTAMYEACQAALWPDEVRAAPQLMAVTHMLDGCIRIDVDEQALCISREKAAALHKLLGCAQEKKVDQIEAHVMRQSEQGASGSIDVTTLSVLDVLEMCERDFSFIGGCTVTDQPSLPPSQRASWKMDVSLVLAAIACAREKLCGPEAA